MRATVVVRVAPRPAPPTVAALTPALPPAERDRAAALHGQRRAEFVAGRVLARRLLGDLLGCPPRDVPLRVDGSGRPQVDGGPSVSLSHAGGLVVAALSRAGDVGVDVEPDTPAPPAVAWSCSPAERAWLDRLPPARVPHAFARLWTRKEACVKAAGTGISTRLARVHCGPGRAGRWGRVRWRELALAPGFAAAVALRPHTEPGGTLTIRILSNFGGLT